MSIHIYLVSSQEKILSFIFKHFGISEIKFIYAGKKLFNILSNN